MNSAEAPPHRRGLPILARQFLLVGAALLVAQAIALVLMSTSPPLRNAPVPTSIVAALLDPAKPASGPRSAGASANGRVEIRVSDSHGPPRPPPDDLDPAAAQAVRLALAALTGAPVDSLVVHVRRGHVLPAPPGIPDAHPLLGEGFYVARGLSDGRLRVVESVQEPFPNAFHRQVIVMLLLGVALLLPLAWVFSLALAGPVRRFAAATQQVGVDSFAPPLPVQGPAEMRGAAEAFNRMQLRIQHLLEERTEMMAAIAHDLRTPLARLSFRLTELPDVAQRRAAADIDEMTSMIARTMEFCSGLGTHGQRDPVDFRLLVESVVDDYTDTGAPVALAASAPVTVRGDALALRRAVGNLVDNALKYGSRARLSLQTTDEQIQLDIDDDGPGIPPALQEQALRPFTRLERSRGRETGGIGLGLTMARATIVDHSGALVLSNRPEGGLRVSVRLPRSPSTRP